MSRQVPRFFGRLPTKLGWCVRFWIFVGCFMLTASICTLHMPSWEKPSTWQILVVEYGFPIVSVLQIAASVLMVFGSVMLLLRKRWSRAMLEGVCWFIVVQLIGSQCFWGYLDSDMADHDSVLVLIFKTFMRVSPFLLSLWFLRSTKLRKSLDGEAESMPASYVYLKNGIKPVTKWGILGGLQLIAIYVVLVLGSPRAVPWPIVDKLTRWGMVTRGHQSHSLHVRVSTRFGIDFETYEPEIDDILRSVRAAPNRVMMIIE